MERVLLEYLVNSAWQTPLVAIAVWLGLRVGRASVRMQHGVWVAALIAAVLLPGVPVRHADGARVTAAASEAAEPVALPAGETGNIEVAGLPEMPSDSHAGDGNVRGSRGGVTRWTLSAKGTRAVEYLYLAVIFFVFARLVWSWTAGRRMVRDSEPAELSARHRALWSRCCEEMGVAAPEVRRSGRAWSPVVIGVRRPVVLLPAGFACSAEAEDVEAVWWHELAHVRRRDYLVNLLCRVGALPIVYHPAAHFVLRRVRRSRELVCDAIAAEKMSSRVVYARCLVALADRAGLAAVTGAEGTAMFGDGALEERVMELLGTRQKASAGVRVLRAMLSAALFAAVAAGVVFFHVTPTLAASGSGELQQAAPTLPAVQPLPLLQPMPLVAPSPVVQPVPVLSPAGLVAVKPVLAIPAPAEAQGDAGAGSAASQGLSPEERERLDKQLADAQRNVDDALKQLNNGELEKKVDEAIRSLNTVEIQRQMADAMKQAKALNSAEMQKKIADAIAKAQAQMNSPEFKKRMEELNSPEFRKRIDEAAERAKQSAEMAGRSAEMQKRMAEMESHMQEMQKHLQEKLDSPEWKKQMEELNSPEFWERMEKLQKQLQEDMKGLRDQQEKGSQASPELKKTPEFQQQQQKGSSNLQARMLKTNLDYGMLMNMGRPLQVAKLQTVPAIAVPGKGTASLAAQAAPEKDLYESGISALREGNYDAARLKLQTLINSYPKSAYLADAKRAIARSWDTEGTLALVHAEEEYQAAGVGAKKLGSGMAAPVLVSQVNPEYTPEAKAAKVKGTVLVNLWVDEQGNVQHVRVLRGLGSGLDEKAIDAVRQYKFKPAMEAGKAVMVALNIEVNFQLF